MMDMLKKAVQTLWTYKWELLAAYMLHLFYGLVVAGQVRSAIGHALGHSLTGQQLYNGYDSDVMADLMRHEGLDLSAAYLGMYGLIFFSLVSVLIYGGIIANIELQVSGVRLLLQNGLNLLAKFLLVSVTTLLASLLVCTAIWVPFLSLSGLPELTTVLEIYHSEREFFLMLGVVVTVTFLLLVLVWSWSILTKTYMVRDSSHPYRTAATTALYSWKKIVLFALLTLVIVVLSLLILITLRNMAVSTWLYILLGQCIILALCKTRLWLIGGITALAKT